MATRAPERGSPERHLVARAEVLATDATGVLARTAADRHPWPQGPFPPPPDRSRPREGRLRIEAVADTVLRVRYAPGRQVRDGGAHTPRCYKAVPFFFTTGGYGVFLHTSSRVTAWAGSRAAHQVQVAVDDDVLDYFVLLGSPADILAGYTALTGRAPVPPAWSFGWWQSRCSYSSAAEVRQVVGEMRSAGIPVDVVHLDTNWFATDWRCDLEFAPDRFPDPAGFCRELAAGGFVGTAGGGLLDIGVHFVDGYQGPVHVIDWTNPAADRVMAEEYGRLFATGASVLKVDFGEELPDGAVYADGTPGARMHDLDPLRYQQAVPAATGAARGEGERIAWSRSGWAGAQRLPGALGRGRVRGLGADAAPAAPGPVAGAVGVQLLVGRHRRHRRAARRRRAADPLAPVGGAAVPSPGPRDGERAPCRWPEPARRVAREWVRLRYRPGAPLFEAGGRRLAYLPAGTWTDWWTRERVRGPRWVEAEHGLGTMPLYLREGAVIPMGPVTQWVGERPTDPLTVVVAPFEGDGRTELDVPVDGREVAIRYEARAGRHRVEVAGHRGEVVLDAPAGVELRR